MTSSIIQTHSSFCLQFFFFTLSSKLLSWINPLLGKSFDVVDKHICDGYGLSQPRKPIMNQCKKFSYAYDVDSGSTKVQYTQQIQQPNHFIPHDPLHSLQPHDSSLLIVYHFQIWQFFMTSQIPILHFECGDAPSKHTFKWNFLWKQWCRDYELSIITIVGQLHFSLSQMDILWDPSDRLSLLNIQLFNPFAKLLFFKIQGFIWLFRLFHLPFFSNLHRVIPR